MRLPDTHKVHVQREPRDFHSQPPMLLSAAIPVMVIHPDGSSCRNDCRQHCNLSHPPGCHKPPGSSLGDPPAADTRLWEREPPARHAPARTRRKSIRKTASGFMQISALGLQQLLIYRPEFRGHFCSLSPLHATLIFRKVFRKYALYQAASPSR